MVLVGAQTASRPWVLYEIGKAWDDKRPLVGVRIHGLEGSNGKTDTLGTNPFSLVKLTKPLFVSTVFGSDTTPVLDPQPN